MKGYLRMCTVKKQPKERAIKVSKRRGIKISEGRVYLEKKEMFVPLKFEGRLCGISDQKLPCTSRVNKISISN